MIELPTCRWRGELNSNDKYPCSSTRLIVNPAGVGRDTCLRCGIADHEPTERYVESVPQPQSKSDTPCIYLGEDTGERQQCDTCQGKVLIKLMGCAVHKQCTTVKKLDGIACCQGCKEYCSPTERSSS